MSQKSEIAALLLRFNDKERGALAKVITMLESRKLERREKDQLLDGFSKKNASLRIAISGPPGVGKSSFINAIGKKLIERGQSLAVLPIDPSSEQTHGSLLADKTRMKDLINEKSVYIRPSPSAGVLGGVSPYTPEVMRAVEAFGFDIVIIETVGVGQSEIMARSLADHFVVLLQPGAGDTISAMKKGILEEADFILVNKADGEQQSLAEKTKVDLKGSRAFYIDLVSSITEQGIADFLDALLSRHRELVANGQLTMLRTKKLERLFYPLLQQSLIARLKEDPRVIKRCEETIEAVEAGRASLMSAIDGLAEELLKKRP